jgi:hypothetical protein
MSYTCSFMLGLAKWAECDGALRGELELMHCGEAVRVEIEKKLSFLRIPGVRAALGFGLFGLIVMGQKRAA